MRELSLFTGAGGGIWGSKLLGWETVGYVEFESYAQKVIAQRIKDGVFDEAPIFGDIRAFISEGYAESYSGLVDIITAGFPCQPFSAAGKRLGEADPRNMWPATAECITTIRPKYALLENVPGLTSTPYFGRIIGDLTEIGYNCEWEVISAGELGAPHLRKRLWILATEQGRTEGPHRVGGATMADAESLQSRRGQQCTRNNRPRYSCSRLISGQSEILADRHTGGEFGGGDWWAVEPDVGRVANGVAARGHRLRALGNGQVPICMAEAFLRLSQE